MAKVHWSSTDRTDPRWAAQFITPRDLLPGGAKIDLYGFPYVGAQTVTLAAAVTEDDEELTVVALSERLPKGAALVDPAGETLIVSETAEAGATTVSIDPAPAAIADAATLDYAGDTNLGRVVKAGTLVGRTRAERAAGAGFGPWDASDEEEYLLAFDVIDRDECELLLPGFVVKENFLPGWDDLAGATQTRIRELYITTVGRE